MDLFEPVSAFSFVVLPAALGGLFLLLTAVLEGAADLTSLVECCDGAWLRTIASSACSSLLCLREFPWLGDGWALPGLELTLDPGADALGGSWKATDLLGVPENGGRVLGDSVVFGSVLVGVDVGIPAGGRPILDGSVADACPEVASPVSRSSPFLIPFGASCTFTWSNQFTVNNHAISLQCAVLFISKGTITII